MDFWGCWGANVVVAHYGSVLRLGGMLSEFGSIRFDEFRIGIGCKFEMKMLILYFIKKLL